jgi:tripartite-type tricarboxylate transporter receptor subunit TctC
MLTRYLIVPVFSAGLMLTGAGKVVGQNFPYRPIRIITVQPGGVGDLIARPLAQGLAGPLGQPVIVENRPSGVIPGDMVAKALPDGYTLLVTSAILWIGPLMQKSPYDPVRDFSPITLLVTTPNVLVVHPSLPAKSVTELIAAAKAKPGALNYASAGAGGSTHLAAELFKAMAGVDIVKISYRGAGPAIVDLLAGQVQLMFATAGSVMPHIHSGKVRALAVTSARPSVLAPGLPTVADSGVPGYASASPYGLLAPAGTPSGIVQRLNVAVLGVINAPEIRERFLNLGVEVVGSSAEQFAVTMKSEITRMGKVIKNAGIRLE